MNRPIIFITSFHILISRNILASSVLKLLRDRGFQVVIFCPKNKELFFRAGFGSADVFIEPVETKLVWRDLILRYLSLSSLQTESLDIKRRTEMKGSGWLVSKILAKGLGRWLIKIFDPLISPHRQFSFLCEKYRPAVIFSTDIMDEIDVRLVHEAKRRKIPVVGMVRSWDNLTSKGALRVWPDRMLVNNEVIKEEAIKFHKVPPEIIKIVGVPHYDGYFSQPKISRENLSRIIGISPDKKFALFVPAGDRYLSDNIVDRDILFMLLDLLPKDWEILVRLPPADAVKAIEGGEFPPRVHVFRPGGNFGSVKNTELSRADDDLLIATLKEVDLVVSGPSTLAVDAALFDKPVVLFGFDGKATRSYLNSVSRYFDYNHWQPIIKSRGAPLAKTAKEFSNMVSCYIAKPFLDREGRGKIVELEAAFTDGKSSERVVKELLSFL